MLTIKNHTVKIKIFGIVIGLIFLFAAQIAHAVTVFDDFNDGNADGWWLGHSQHTPWIDGNWRVEDIGSPHDGVLVEDGGGDHFIALLENIQFSNQTVETQSTVGLGRIMLNSNAT